MPKSDNKTDTPENVKEVHKPRLVVEEETKVPVEVKEPIVPIAPVVPATPAAPVAPVISQFPLQSVGNESSPTISPPVTETVGVVDEKKQFPKWLLFVIGLGVGALLGVAVVLAWGMYSNQKEVGMLTDENTEKQQSEDQPKPTVEPTLAVTPTPKLSRSDLKVRIENGSGVKGAAAKASDYLEGLGYQVVSTGNSASDVAITEIKIKTNKEMFSSLLVSDLGEKYKTASQAGVLEAKAEYDVLVTVGE